MTVLPSQPEMLTGNPACEKPLLLGYESPRDRKSPQVQPVTDQTGAVITHTALRGRG